MNIAQHRVASGVVFLVSAWICWISFTQKPAEAFLFPRVISVFFLIFSAITFAKAMLGRTKVGNGLSMGAAKNLAPGLTVAAIYIFWAAKALGFYVAGTLTFFILLSLYDPSPHGEPKSWIRRLLVTAGFLGIMYLLFAVVLKVYTPKGMFF